MPRTATDMSGKAARSGAGWRRAGRSSAAMRCPPGTTTVCILASEVIGPGPSVGTSATTVATHRARRRRFRDLRPCCPIGAPSPAAVRRCRAWTSRSHRTSPTLLGQLDDFIEQVDQADRAAGRQHPLLRPSPRGRPHRLGARRPAQRGVGAAAPQGQAPGRRRRLLPLAVPQGVRRQRRQQPGHGDHPRAPRDEGPRAAQRPAERALDRRQPGRPDPDDRVRHRGAEGGVDRRPRRRPQGLRLRHHRAAARLRRDLDGDPRRARRRRVGDQRREDVEHRHPQGRSTT